jgi:RNase P/RNase MRP subunit POP5
MEARIIAHAWLTPANFSKGKFGDLVVEVVRSAFPKKYLKNNLKAFEFSSSQGIYSCPRHAIAPSMPPNACPRQARVRFAP